MARGDQDLVPRNLPYGGRQQYVQAAQSGGVPLSSRSGPAGPGAAPPGRPGAAGAEQLISPDMDLFNYADPNEVPGLDLTPQGRLEVVKQEMYRLAVSAPNPLVRAIAATWLRRQQGAGG